MSVSSGSISDELTDLYNSCQQPLEKVDLQDKLVKSFQVMQKMLDVIKNLEEWNKDLEEKILTCINCHGLPSHKVQRSRARPQTERSRKGEDLDMSTDTIEPDMEGKQLEYNDMHNTSLSKVVIGNDDNEVPPEEPDSKSAECNGLQKDIDRNDVVKTSTPLQQCCENEVTTSEVINEVGMKENPVQSTDENKASSSVGIYEVGMKENPVQTNNESKASSSEVINEVGMKENSVQTNDENKASSSGIMEEINESKMNGSQTARIRKKFLRIKLPKMKQRQHHEDGKTGKRKSSEKMHTSSQTKKAKTKHVAKKIDFNSNENTAPECDEDNILHKQSKRDKADFNVKKVLPSGCKNVSVDCYDVKTVVKGFNKFKTGILKSSNSFCVITSPDEHSEMKKLAELSHLKTRLLAGNVRPPKKLLQLHKTNETASLHVSDLENFIKSLSSKSVRRLTSSQNISDEEMGPDLESKDNDQTSYSPASDQESRSELWKTCFSSLSTPNTSDSESN